MKIQKAAAADEQQQQQQQPQKQKQQQEPSSLYYQYNVTTGSLSAKTRYSYTRYINDFLAHFKITDIQPLREYSLKVIKQMVKDYVIYLRDVKKASHSSIKSQLSGVAHFFYIERDDEYKIDWKKVRMEIPPDENIKGDRAYTVEEIQKMLSVCPRTRDKVIIHLLVSTGLRIGAIHSLRIGDLSPKRTTNQGEKKIYRIDVYARTSAQYSAYCNTETAQIIDSYLKERTDAGEPSPLKNDSPLIRNLYSSLTVKRPKKVSDSMIKYIVDRIVKLSGIKNTFQFTGEARRGTGFRKFYKTQAENAGMKPINVEITHGHSIGISSHYYRPQESEILQDYMDNAADALTINQEFRLKKKVDELETERVEELDRMKGQLARVMADRDAANKGVDKLRTEVMQMGYQIARINANRVANGETLSAEDIMTPQTAQSIQRGSENRTKRLNAAATNLVNNLEREINNDSS